MQLQSQSEKSYASEGGHWYRADGTPVYTIVGKNGRERATTLRDARVHNFFPSVTGIIEGAAAPALERWRREQVLLSALTLPRALEESEYNWLARVIEDSQATAKRAAEEGTRIHGALQLSFEGQAFDLPYAPHVSAVHDQLKIHYGELPWIAEQSFAHPDGFGGKTDLHCDRIIVDFKSKDFAVGDTLDLYDNHPIQLAGYAHGLGIENPAGAIMFISRSSPGVVRLVSCDAADMARGLAMFKALLQFWQCRTGYKPVWPTVEIAA